MQKRKKRRSSCTRLERCIGPHFQLPAYSVITGTVNCAIRVMPFSRQKTSNPSENGFGDLTAHTGAAPMNSDRILRVVLFAFPLFGAATACMKLLTACVTRSEEHTSELQSLRHLVCR